VKPDLQIRRTDTEDLAALLALYGELHPEDPVLRSGDLATPWAQILREGHPRIFVKELDGMLVTTCTLAVVPNLTRGARPYGLIENVVTRSDHRCRGYGTAILRHALQYAWRVNCYKVMLLTGSKREETLHFYEAAGFVRGIKTGFLARPPVS
jgi:GNAT superfamily N-acetyltransferase